MSNKLQQQATYDTPLIDEGWALKRPAAGQQLREPAPLFSKLEPEVAEQEEERLLKASA